MRSGPTPSDAARGDAGAAVEELLGIRRRLLADHTVCGRALSAAWTAAVDRAVRRVLAAAVDSRGAHGPVDTRPDGTPCDVALVAVGGYGRGELAPGSDLDLVLLHRGTGDPAGLAEAVWYPLWDAGLRLGHAVRTVAEALELASGDLATATALLDVRTVGGDRALGDELADRARQRWRSRWRRWLPALAAATGERHRRFGEVAFLLEPDLKEARGGLRDIHNLRWVELARPVLHDGDAEELADAEDLLAAARAELHRRAGRASDRLMLEDQDAVAGALRVGDADALVARLADAARRVAWIADEALDRVTGAARGPIGRLARRDRRLGEHLILRDGEIHLAAGTEPAADPALALRAAAEAATRATRIARPSLDRLARLAPPLAGPWPPGALDALVRLLGSGRRAIPVLEALDHRGVLHKVLPEWASVRSRPQRTPYHRFTVDRHLCEAAAEAALLTHRVDRPDILLVAAWLHDLGKGQPGDHTDAGVTLLGEIAPRMGFDRPDVAALTRLVRHHLLLADVATRRDLRDASTLRSVASAVGDRPTLRQLHALTEADSRATGPTAWTAWKAALVGQLVAGVDHLLAGGDPPDAAGSALPTAEHRRFMASGGVTVRGEGDRLTVVAPDRPGLLARVAGMLCVCGLEVLGAEAATGDRGMAVEVLRVEGGPEDREWDRVEREVRRALEEPVALAPRVAARAATWRPGRPKAPAPVAPEVRFDTELTSTATVVEVRAADDVGLLYRLAAAIADLGLDIGHAKVQTLAHEVVDSFYVRHPGGAAVTDAAHLRELERALLHAAAG